MHKRSITALCLGVVLLISMQPALAAGSSHDVKVRNSAAGKSTHSLDAAISGSRVVTPLGFAIDKGKVVEGYAIVDYKSGNGKGGHPSDKGPKGGKPGSNYYQFLAKGARWKATEPEPYVLDTTNHDGLSAGFVANVIAASMNTWDAEVSFDIFGSKSADTVDGPDTVAPDDKNEIMFGNISEDGVIAVTIVWGYFSGPPSLRELVEYDIVFDDADFNFGDAEEMGAAVMDLQNIATHELGHAAGLADLYEDACREETMYGYASNGETKKRTLNAGDIAGIQALYK
jgi:hypothetical protein